MAESATWQEIVASSLDWEQSHANLDSVLADLTAEDRGRRAPGHPHSVWDLVEHIRIAQHDLLEFCNDSDYAHELELPPGYWPPSHAPDNDAAWKSSLAAIKQDRDALVAFTTSGKVD